MTERDSIDVHKELLPYNDVLSLFEEIERKNVILEYCNGANAGGRLVFQFLNQEFVAEIATAINGILKHSENSGPVLEVMSGDGKLVEFLRPLIQRNIEATDSRTGHYSFAYPKWVHDMEAVEAVRTFTPSLILISWEPYWSSIGSEIVDTGIPTIWIGDKSKSAVNSVLFDNFNVRLNSTYALGRHDSVVEAQYNTDAFFFNCQQRWIETRK